MLTSHIVIDHALSFGNIIYMYNVRQHFILLEFADQVPASFQFFRRVMHGLAVVEYRRIENLRFHQILENMAAVG